MELSFCDILVIQAISEVLAFPTMHNYSTLLSRAKYAYRSFVIFSRAIEMGEHSASSSLPCDADEPKLDPETRSKLNAFGTHYWNSIQKHPELFLDVYPIQDHRSSSTKESFKQPDEIAIASNELEACRGAASGFIRALACRLILISKFHTKENDVPQLILSHGLVGTSEELTSSSCHDSIPVALASELEFGLKVFTRAGKALMSHSQDHFKEAYDVLSLATVCWDGIKRCGVASIEDHTCVEAFDAMLMLPDCVVKIAPTKKDTDMQNERHGQEVETFEALSQRLVRHLQSLERFVDEQLNFPGDEKNGKTFVKSKIALFATQHYLPSLARMGYKVSMSCEILNQKIIR